MTFALIGSTTCIFTDIKGRKTKKQIDDTWDATEDIPFRMLQWTGSTRFELEEGITCRLPANKAELLPRMQLAYRDGTLGFMTPRIISIDGNVASGKTAILTELHRRGFRVIFEEETSRPQAMCSSDPTRWACTLHMARLIKLGQVYRKMISLGEGVVFVERTPRSIDAMSV